MLIGEPIRIFNDLLTFFGKPCIFVFYYLQSIRYHTIKYRKIFSISDIPNNAFQKLFDEVNRGNIKDIILKNLSTPA